MERMRGLIIYAVAALAAATASASWAAPPAPPASAAPRDDGQWIMPAKNYASTRFSELSQVSAGNVGGLQVAFTFSTGVDKGQEAAPIVADGVMYIVSPYPNTVFALDLTKPG